VLRLELRELSTLNLNWGSWGDQTDFPSRLLISEMRQCQAGSGSEAAESARILLLSSPLAILKEFGCFGGRRKREQVGTARMADGSLLS